MGEIRIVLADDHKIVRAGIRRIINSEDDMTVVGEANDGREATYLVQELKPEVIVLDISMPKVSGLVAAGIIKRTVPTVSILALTRHTDRAYLQELLQAGISGYVLKQSESEVMLRAIRAIADGGQFLDPAISDSIISIVSASQYKQNTGSPGISLTDRELDVLRRVARGYSNREIADQLDTSLKTIEMQKASALKKLDIRGRNQIVDFAILQGWFEESD